MVSISARAQTHAVDQGSLLIDGNVSLTSTGSNDDGDRVTNIMLSPSVQYFVVPGLAVGASFSLERQASDGFSRTTYGVGPSVSYYFGASVEKAIYPFVAVGVNYFGSRFDFDGDTDTETLSAYGVGASGGVLVMLSGSVGVTGRLFYEVQDYSDDFDEDLRTNAFGFAFGIAAFVF